MAFVFLLLKVYIWFRMHSRFDSLKFVVLFCRILCWYLF